MQPNILIYISFVVSLALLIFNSIILGSINNDKKDTAQTTTTIVLVISIVAVLAFGVASYYSYTDKLFPAKTAFYYY